jgi:hypothetical protein
MRRSLARLLSEARRVSASQFRLVHTQPFLVPIGYRAGAVETRADRTAIMHQDDSGKVALFGPHPLAGQVVVLDPDEGRPFTIGRGADASLLLSDDAISVVHAELRVSLFGITVEDFCSTNGTRLNDRVLPARVATAVEDGDVLTFGRYRFQLFTAVSLYNELAGVGEEHRGDDSPEDDEEIEIDVEDRIS